MNAKRIDPGPDTQAAIAAIVEADAATAALWGMTYEVLAGRAGWDLYVDENGEHAWFFGWEDQALLVVSVEPYGIECFHWRPDVSHSLDSAVDLWKWVTSLEDEEEQAGVRDLTAMRVSLREYKDAEFKSAHPEIA